MCVQNILLKTFQIEMRMIWLSILPEYHMKYYSNFSKSIFASSVIPMRKVAINTVDFI